MENFAVCNTYSAIIDQISRQGWAVCEGLLTDQDIKSLAEEAKALWSNGSFRPAGIGRGRSFRISPDIRGDYILWLDEDSLTPAQKRYCDEIERLRLELNRELFTSLSEFEAHLAVYPPGAFYKKHLDRFSDSQERVISCTLYLNSHWRESDGGALRIYLDQTHFDIQPKAGTFVAFRSDAIYHEVLAATKERFSLTGWLKRRSLQLHLAGA
jgi:SM-20-related protein